jgi:sugar lactone lactonase YvrE
MLSGVVLGTSPRWHDGRLWFADWGAGEIVTISDRGSREFVFNVASFPFAFDWLPDGRMLILDSNQRVLVRREASGRRSVHANLAAFGPGPWSALAVDARGTAYAANVDTIVAITSTGLARTVARDLAEPAALAVSADARTLLVAEGRARRLRAFDISADGNLVNGRHWASLPDAPRGLCLDADLAVWVAAGRGCMRVTEGGDITQTVTVDRDCFGCALGGADDTTLFITATNWPGREAIDSMGRHGLVLTVPASVPHARATRTQLRAA